MKKSLIALFPLIITSVSGCSLLDKIKELANKDNTGEEIIKPMECEGGVCAAITEIKGTSATPTKAHYLPLGKTQVYSITADGISTINESQLKFTWTCTSSNVELSVSENTRKCTVSAKSIGKATLVCSYDYAPETKAYFTINVIDKKDTDYLWTYFYVGTAIKEQFGYNSSSAKKGTTSGTAILPDSYTTGVSRSWQYTRSGANDLGSGNGGIKFGKNVTADTKIIDNVSTRYLYGPEDVTLTSENNRTIKAIHIEAASKKGYATLNVKVGETSVYSKNVAADYYSDCNLIDIPVNNLSGNIEINFDNPDIDEEAYDNDLYYDGPGAVYLKSIWIEFAD